MIAIVMGLDQHRAQIAAEWIDTDTGEIGRARISPALPGDVRRFFTRFAGQRLEVALEATTGWRFVADELRAIGADAIVGPRAPAAARGSVCDRPVVGYPARLAVSGARWSAPAAGV